MITHSEAIRAAPHLNYFEKHKDIPEKNDKDIVDNKNHKDIPDINGNYRDINIFIIFVDVRNILSYLFNILLTTTKTMRILRQPEQLHVF